MVEFTPYEINLCLYDKERTKRFQKAIKTIVKADSVVIDAGAGTGILALFAAKAGAKKVYALEINKRFVQVAKENVRRNGFEKIIKVIHCDAKKFRPPEKVDVVICELLATGLFFEPENKVFCNIDFLCKNLIDNYSLVSTIKFIPEKSRKRYLFLFQT